MSIPKFPENLRRCAYASEKKQKWNTKVQKSESGKYRSLSTQLYPEWIISTKIQFLTDAEARDMQGFVALRKGGSEPFFWKDPEDYKEEKVQLPRLASGQYQAVMRQGSYVEPVEAIEKVTVYINGAKQPDSAYSIIGGVIGFKTAPAMSDVITADYEYFWKVRFHDDGMGVDHIFDDINRTNTFKLVVAR